MTLSNLPKKNDRKVVSTEQTLNAVGKPKIEANGISLDSPSLDDCGRPHGRNSIRELTNRVSLNASTSLNWLTRTRDGGGPKNLGSGGCRPRCLEFCLAARFRADPHCVCAGAGGNQSYHRTARSMSTSRYATCRLLGRNAARDLEMWMATMRSFARNRELMIASLVQGGVKTLDTEAFHVLRM